MSQIIGKIIFYSVNDGKGIIISEDKKKYPFEVIEWDDFDYSPAIDMLVSFSVKNNRATSIVVETNHVSSEAQLPSNDENEIESHEVIDELANVSTFLEHVERPSFIPLDKNVDTTVHEYFAAIEANIKERTNFQMSKMRLDFLRIRRFLFTTYNNLTELDTHFITPEIKKIRDDLIQMSRVYDDYKVKTTYPDVAFEKIFLSQQSEYVKIQHESELMFKEIQKHRISEQFLSKDLEERDEVLKTVLRTSTQFIRLMKEHKDIKRKYVDAVHMIATYESLYRVDLQLLSEFETKYKEDFFDKFSLASKRYRKQILFILDAQAYAFDAQLWRQARKSTVIRQFFKTSHIDGDYCAKTYLKYYLNTLDPQMLSKEQSDLFELYKYLESIEHKTALAVFKDVDDVLRVKYLISKLSFDMEIEAFVDEKKAMIWAEQNSYNVLIVDAVLDSMYGAKFLERLYRRSKIKADIIMIGSSSEKVHKSIKISKTLPSNFRDKELMDTISKLYEEEE